MKNLILVMIALLFVQRASAQKESCKVLLEKISGTYNGDCQNGLANGKGKSIGEDTYSGIFKDGLPDGKGKYVFKNGDVFQGLWKEGRKNGKGKFDFTLGGVKQSMTGYWRMDEYTGLTDPDLEYRVVGASGLASYKVEKKESAVLDKEILLSIKSAFSDFVPADLLIENSSGQLVPSGKKVVINQFVCPLHVEISYTITVGASQKQCRFIVDFIKEGKYVVMLSND